MNKISLVYYSSTGNTYSMAKAIEEGRQDPPISEVLSTTNFLSEEGIIEAGGKVTVYKASEMNKDDILSSDVIAMGSPAMGAEVIDENYLLPFMEEDGPKFKGKKVYIFGSYGWGGGEYADNWKAQLEGFGANIVAMPILANEEPNEEELAQLKEIGKKLVTI